MADILAGFAMPIVILALHVLLRKPGEPIIPRAGQPMSGVYRGREANWNVRRKK